MATTKHDKAASFPHMDWNLLKYFLVIVEAGGITRAAERLGRKQPAVSLALKRLEQRLNTRLCQRGPKGFLLTEEGLRLAENCALLSDFIRHLPETMSDATPSIRGTIRIRLISNLVDRHLDDAISTFHRKYPNIEIQVDVETWSNVLNALLRQEIDIGVAPSLRKRAELIYLPLFKELHRPYCGRGHALYGHRVINPRALADEPFILTGSDEPDQLSDFRLTHGLGRRVAGISAHLEEAKRLTILGVGICFLPEGYAAPEVASGRLWPLLGKRSIPSMPIYIITNPKGPAHMSRQLFIDEFMTMMEQDSTPGPPQSKAKKARARGLPNGRRKP